MQSGRRGWRQQPIKLGQMLVMQMIKRISQNIRSLGPQDQDFPVAVGKPVYLCPGEGGSSIITFSLWRSPFSFRVIHCLALFVLTGESAVAGGGEFKVFYLQLTASFFLHSSSHSFCFPSRLTRGKYLVSPFHFSLPSSLPVFLSFFSSLSFLPFSLCSPLTPVFEAESHIIA